MKKKFIEKNVMQHIINNSSGQYRLLYKILANTGKRITEVLSLRVQDVDTEHGTITWTILKRRTPVVKTKKYDNPELFLTIKKYCSEARVNDKDFLFGGRGKLGHLTRQAVDKNLKKIGRYSAHMFRHGVGHILAENEKTPFDIKHFLDHATVRTTEHYGHVSGKRQLETTRLVRV